MIDYLFSSMPPGKGVDRDPVETGLPSILANIALVVGTIILRPAIERHIHPAIWGHIPTSVDKRQFLKSVLSRRDLLSPVLDGLSTLRLRVKPSKAAIATAVTVVKAAPTPVQNFQEQSSFSAIMCIIACMVLALAGTVLSYQHFRQDASWSSPSPASSDNSDSSPEPYSRDATPPNDDSSDEDSGSGGHPPPVPIFDLFYDLPILHLDKAVDTSDERVRDEDGPPPPPPPSFPTPVEDGDGFPRKPFISKWLSLTLVLSIISLVIKRFFKVHGKIQNEASTPVSTSTVSERITVNEISGDVVTLFPSATPNPVIETNPTCPNLLPLVEIEPKPESLSVSTLVTSTVSQRSTKFMFTSFKFSLFMSCLFGLAFLARYFLNYYLQRTTNTFLPMAIRRQLLDEIIASFPITTSLASSLPLVPTFAPSTDDTASSDELKATTVHDEKTDDLPLAPTFAPETDDAAGIDEVNAPTGDNEEIDGLLLTPTFEPETEDDTVSSDEVNAATIKSLDFSSSPINSVEQEVSLDDVGGNTLVIYEKAFPLVNLEDVFTASASVTSSTVSSLRLVPTFVPATDDTTGRNELNISAVDDEKADDLPLAPTFAPETDDAAGNDEVDITIGGDEEIDGLLLVAMFAPWPKNSIQQELSFNDVGDNTLVIYDKDSPLVDLEDVFDAPENGVPFLEVFRGLSISGPSDEVPISNEKPTTSTTSMFGLPNSGKRCIANGKGIKVLSEHVPKLNIPILAKKVQPVALARSHTLPSICGDALVRNSTTNRKPFSVESLNSEPASFVPPSHIPTRQSSCTSLHYRYSPPSPVRPGLSASIHAPSPQRNGLNASIHASISPSLLDDDLCDNIYAPRTLPRPNSSTSTYARPRPDLSTSIHAPRPCTLPKTGLNASIHAPSGDEPTEPCGRRSKP